MGVKNGIPQPLFSPCRAVCSAFRLGKSGFSLIEVALALGIVSFILLPAVALLPVGLESVQASSTQTVTTNIAQQIRGQLQELTYTSLQSLPTTTYYYTSEGNQTTSSDPEVYYKSAFTVTQTPVPGGGGSNFDSVNAAETVKVTTVFPVSAPVSSQKSIVFAFLAAKQGSN